MLDNASCTSVRWKDLKTNERFWDKARQIMSLIYCCFVLLCFVLCLLLLFQLVCLLLFSFGCDILQSCTQEFHAVSHKNFTQFHARISVGVGMLLRVINVSKPLHNHKTTRGCIKLAFTPSSSFSF